MKTVRRPFVSAWCRSAFGYSFFHAYHALKALRLYRKGRLESPFILQVQTVSGCNGQCRLCPSGKPSSKRMSDETFAHVLDLIEKNKDVRKVDFVLQNEPTLDAFLGGRIDAVKKIRPDVLTEIVTNGSLLTGRNAARLLDSQLDICAFSIDTIDPELFAELRGGMDLNKILANLRELKRNPGRRFDLLVRCTKSRHNARGIPELKRHFRRDGIPVIVWPASNRNNRIENSELDDRQYRRARKFLGIPCLFPFLILCIDHDGNMLLCCNDYSAKSWGNVADPSVKGGWKEAFAGVRAALVRRDFSYCARCSNY